MPDQSAAAPGPGALLFPFAMMFLIFYLLVFRPQTKTRKQHEALLKGLKKHDEVVTSGGLIGTIVNLKPGTLTLRIDENVRVEVERSSISRLVKSKAQDDGFLHTCLPMHQLARRGWSAQKILAFYYPNAQLVHRKARVEEAVVRMGGDS